MFKKKKKNHKKKAINIAKCTVLPAKVRLKDLKPGSSNLLIWRLWITNSKHL